MRKFNLIATIIVSFLCAPMFINAQEYTMLDKCSERLLCTIKTEPNENGNYVDKKNLWYLEPGDVVSIIDGTSVSANSKKCSTHYVKVKYQSYEGYVCDDYINHNVDTTYYQELKNAGFPESYLVSLNALKKIHSNWNFVAVNTGIDWNKLVNTEYFGSNYKHASNPNGADAKYLSLDGDSYNETTKTFIQKSPGGYYKPNKETLAYYLDPRNFLEETKIFMFEDNKINLQRSEDKLRESLKNVLDIKDSTSNESFFKKYFDSFVSAKKLGVNPVFIASRVRQEKGIITSENGIKKNGYYNLFNIGAFDSCTDPNYCGAEFASKKGWDTPEKAIIGGAYWILENYINNSQYTIYFQKFGVTFGNDRVASHQYMTNVEAPLSESAYLYKAYKTAGSLLDSTTFYIPVYENMPASNAMLPTKVNKEEKNNIDNISNNTKNMLDIASIVNGSGYRYSDTTITNISPGTNIDSFAQKIQAMSSDAKIIIDSKNSNSQEPFIGTGDTIVISNNNTTKTLRMIVYGDDNGDGKINIDDLVDLQKKLLKRSGYIDADDVDHNGEINIDDLVKIQETLLQRTTITQ